MTNQILTGNASFKAAANVVGYRCVKLTGDGVEHAGASDDVYGVAIQNAYKAPVVTIGQTDRVTVVTSPAIINIACDSTDDLKTGDKVHAAADGKVAKAGTKPVGFVVRKGRKHVSVRLVTPLA